MLRNARRAIHCVGTGLRTHAILAQGAKHAMDKGHLHDSVPHSRIFGEGGLSPEVVGTVRLEQEMQTETEPMVGLLVGRNLSAIPLVGTAVATGGPRTNVFLPRFPAQ